MNNQFVKTYCLSSKGVFAVQQDKTEKLARMNLKVSN